MNAWLILPFVYAGVGLVTTLCMLYVSAKKGRPSPFPLLGGDPVDLFAWFVLWPVFTVIAGIDLTFADPQKGDIQQDQKEIPTGQVGATQTKMRPSGKVKMGEDLVDAYSLSGYLEPGEAVVIVSKEMSYYKIQRVEPMASPHPDKSVP